MPRRAPTRSGDLPRAPRTPPRPPNHRRRQWTSCCCSARGRETKAPGNPGRARCWNTATHSQQPPPARTRHIPSTLPARHRCARRAALRRFPISIVRLLMDCSGARTACCQPAWVPYSAFHLVACEEPVPSQHSCCSPRGGLLLSCSAILPLSRSPVHSPLPEPHSNRLSPRQPRRRRACTRARRPLRHPMPPDVPLRRRPALPLAKCCRC